MATRNFPNRLRLVALAGRIAMRKKALGIGLHNQCWGGIAAEIAQVKDSRTTDYFGLSFSELKAAIKSNNLCVPSTRNRHMIFHALKLALGR